jgi:hypothetical protein
MAPQHLLRLPHRIARRPGRDAQANVFQCMHCGHVGVGAEPRVSVRAMILSLGRFGIAPADQPRAREGVGNIPEGEGGGLVQGGFCRCRRWLPPYRRSLGEGGAKFYIKALSEVWK